MNSYRVGIVIPAYNAATYLRESVASALAQTHQNLVCVISNDGSSDATGEIAETLASNDPRLSVVHHSNGGVSLARNRGANHVQDAEMLLFLDADDILDPDAITTMIETLSRHPEAVACHGYAEAMDHQGAPIPNHGLADVLRHRHCLQQRRLARNQPTDPTSFYTLSVNNSIISPGAVLIRKGAFDQVGGFDTSFSGTADWDLWIRLSRLSELPFVDQRVMRYRISSGAMSSNRATMVSEIQKVRRRILNDPANSPEQAKFARLAYKIFYRDLAQMRMKIALRALSTLKFQAAFVDLRLSVSNWLLSIWGRPPFFLIK